MAKRGLLNTTRKTLVKAAKVGAQGVEDVATDALGAAATAVAGVVVERVSDALGSSPAEGPATSSQGASANTTRSRRKPGKKRDTTKGRSATKARSRTKARTAA